MSEDSIIKLGDNENEVMKLFEIRDWLEDAVRAAGAEIEGAGVGIDDECAGLPNFDFTLGGRRYWVDIGEDVEYEPPEDKPSAVPTPQRERWR